MRIQFDMDTSSVIQGILITNPLINPYLLIKGLSEDRFYTSVDYCVGAENILWDESNVEVGKIISQAVFSDTKSGFTAISS